MIFPSELIVKSLKTNILRCPTTHNDNFRERMVLKKKKKKLRKAIKHIFKRVIFNFSSFFILQSGPG